MQSSDSGRKHISLSYDGQPENKAVLEAVKEQRIRKVVMNLRGCNFAAKPMKTSSYDGPILAQRTYSHCLSTIVPLFVIFREKKSKKGCVRPLFYFFV